MKFKNDLYTRWIPGLLISALLMIVSANAAESREATPGYGTDSGNNVIRTENGDCLHTGDWTPDNG